MTAMNERCPCGSGKKFKKCCANKKPRQHSMDIGFVFGSEPINVYFGADMSYVGAKHDTGEEVQPSTFHSQRSYMRESGKEKVVFRLNGEVTNEYQLNMKLAEFDVVYAVDTNTKQVDDMTVSVCVAVESYFTAFNDRAGTKLLLRPILARTWATKDQSPPKVHPEKRGWEFLFGHVLINDRNKNVAVVTDHDLQNIEAYNRREKPFMEGRFVLSNCTLMYAGSDTKADSVLNRLMSRCDLESRKLIEQFVNEIRGEPPQPTQWTRY
ncbi:MAG: SEC-C domain-containing protein [Planctomycetes bacterium]|nr:SEC-C domain-containing protein [Planctomycetota bacterium]